MEYDFRYINMACVNYDADLYNVEREFDLTINGLTVESSADKLNKNAEKTHNEL